MRISHIARYGSRRSTVLARNVVATSQPLATQAGLSMLAKGGNAMDAALAAAIALVVVEPTGNGLGSDAFCILWDGETLHGFNASGRSPTAWSRDRFSVRRHMPFRGWESVTVPGAVAGWRDLSDRFGKLPFEDLFEPAIGYAERGFHVSPVIAELWRRGTEELRDYPGFAEAFLIEGRAPAAGEVFKLPSLARSLRLIAESRGDTFYRGELAGRIAQFAREHGAVLTEDDLASHANDWCGTVSQAFGEAELHEIPPNGQGIAACMALGILRELMVEEHAPDSAEAWHLQIEAMKLALADAERYVGDPGFMTDVTAGHLLAPGYLASRSQLIDRNRAQVFGAGAPREGGTVCLAAGDEQGMMVSYIQSNYAGFGSGVVVPGTGISLQNRGNGFSLTPGHPNEIAPSKRPFHTIIPGFLTKAQRPLAAFGLMGGPMQAQGHVQMVLRMQAWGQDPQTAADAPRWRVASGYDVAVEASADESLLTKLASLGHAISPQAPEEDFGFGGAQIVYRIDDGYIAGSDPRKDGQAAGF